MPKESGLSNILVLITAVGLIAFILISNSIGFEDKLFGSLFPKPASYAAETVVSQLENSVNQARVSNEVGALTIDARLH